MKLDEVRWEEAGWLAGYDMLAEEEDEIKDFLWGYQVEENNVVVNINRKSFFSGIHKSITGDSAVRPSVHLDIDLWWGPAGRAIPAACQYRIRIRMRTDGRTDRRTCCDRRRRRRRPQSHLCRQNCHPRLEYIQIVGRTEKCKINGNT